ncbi:MAG: lipopolysaccharide biosynthesis protein [Candidatus Hodarchaeota archaeon]
MRFLISINKYIKNTIYRLFRVSKMGFMLALGSAACLGTEKFLVIPILLTILDDSKVGHFVWLLAIARIFGRFASGGVSDCLMRLYTKALEDGVWPALVRRGTELTILISVVSVLIAGIFYLFFDSRSSIADKLVMVIPLGIYLSLLSGRVVLNTFFRVELQFGKIALLDLLSAAGLLLAIPLSVRYELTGLSFAYAVSSLLGIGASIIILRKHIQKFEVKIGDWNRRLLTAAPIFALTSMMGVAYYQAGRIILGIYRPYSEVIVFFAAESIVAVVMMPMVYISGVIYSFVSRKDIFKENQQTIVSQHIVCCLISAVGLYFIINLTGAYLLPVFFSGQAEAALVLLKILSIGGAMKALFMFSRAFIYKYSTYRVIILFTASSFILNISLLFALTPIYGLKGASWAVTGSNIYIAILWFGAYISMCFLNYGKTSTEANLSFSE